MLQRCNTLFSFTTTTLNFYYNFLTLRLLPLPLRQQYHSEHVRTYSPLRRIVMVSATDSTSSRKCEMNTMALPWSARLRRISINLRASVLSSRAVGAAADPALAQFATYALIVFAHSRAAAACGPGRRRGRWRGGGRARGGGGRGTGAGVGDGLCGQGGGRGAATESERPAQEDETRLFRRAGRPLRPAAAGDASRLWPRARGRHPAPTASTTPAAG